jgi:hypothetical protein
MDIGNHFFFISFFFIYRFFLSLSLSLSLFPGSSTGAQTYVTLQWRKSDSSLLLLLLPIPLVSAEDGAPPIGFVFIAIIMSSTGVSISMSCDAVTTSAKILRSGFGA